MKITITEQILRGNLNDGFMLDEYLDALHAEYERTVEHFYPGAQVEISFDVQNASGACRDIDVAVYNDDGEFIDDGSDYHLSDWLNNDASKLADDERWYA